MSAGVYVTCCVGALTDRRVTSSKTLSRVEEFKLPPPPPPPLSLDVSDHCYCNMLPLDPSLNCSSVIAVNCAVPVVQ